MKKKIETEESELLFSVENSEWNSIKSKNKELLKYKANAQKTLHKVHPVIVNIPENDFILLQRKSLDTGISTEMLVRSLIHKYALGKVKLSV